MKLGSRKKIVIAILSTYAVMNAPVYALPNGASIAHGNVQFTKPSTQVLNVVNSPNAIINWQQFGLKKEEITRFIQQSANSAVLNRVVGGNPSHILGKILSNGQVFLINQNGIVFGRDSVVNTGDFVASTLNITDKDFINKNYHFQASPKGAGDIENLGLIKNLADGNIILIAPNINNKGIIEVKDGNLILAAGEKVILTSWDEPELRFEVQAKENKITNLGKLIADNSAVKMFAGTLQHDGLVRAKGLSVDAQGNIVIEAKANINMTKSAQLIADGEKGGKIKVKSEQGDVRIEGEITAKGTQNTGGSISLSAEKLAITSTAKIDASGEKGGGAIQIGGGYRGQDDNISDAKQIYLAKGAEITADAKTSGDGGQVIAYADATAQVYAEISAKGGKQSGDGGLVETSGRRYLEIGEIPPSVSAEQGDAGIWLIDPENVVINNADNNSSSPGIADPGPMIFLPVNPSTATTINAETINSALNAGANVIIDTTSVGTDSGNITVDAAISKTADGGNSDGSSLTFKAHNDININAAISSTVGVLGLSLIADQDLAGGGEIHLGNVALSTNGGLINATGKKINIAAGATINANLNVKDLNLTGGTLTTSGNITVAENFNFNNAVLRGTGTLTTVADSNTVLSPTGSSTLNDSVIWNNAGVVNFNATSHDHFALQGTSQFVNTSTGFVHLNSTDTNSTFYGTGVFNNQGNLSKASGSTHSINANFNNTGTVTVNHPTGAIALGNGGTDTGNYVVTDGAINFQGGTRVFDGISITGAKHAVLNGATLTLKNGTNTSIERLQTTSGTINGDGNLTVTKDFIANNVTIRGNGNLITPTNSTTTLSSTHSVTLNDDRTWTNTGTVNFNSASYDHLSLQGTSEFVNAAGGVFNLNTTDTNSTIYGSGTFTNIGTLNKTTSNRIQINAQFDNSGTVVVNHATGGIAVGNSGDDTGSYTLTNGFVEFYAGTRNFNGINLLGSGQVKLTGATLALNTDTTTSIDNLLASSGIVTGDGDLNINDSFSANNVTLRGAGNLVTQIGSTTTLSAANSNTMNDSRVWTNHGTVNFAATSHDHFSLQGTSQFINSTNGTFNITTSDANSTVYGTGTFTNSGTLNKTSASTTHINSVFNNSGNVVMNHATGAIDFGNGGTDSGSYTADLGSINFQGGTREFGTGVMLGGTGTTHFNGATVNVNTGSMLDSSGTVKISAGTLNLISGTPKNWANLHILGGTLKGGDDISVTSGMQFTGGTYRGTGNLITEIGTMTSLAANASATMRDSVSWTNKGTVNYAATSYDHFSMHDTSQFINDAGGIFNLNSSDSNSQINGTGSFTNAGTLNKLTASSQTVSSVFHNTGSVVVDNPSGNISFSNGGNDTGNYQVSDGSVSFTSGTRTFDGINLTGAGEVVFSGGTLSLNTGTTTSIDNFRTTSGTVTGAGNLEITTSFNTNATTFSGSGDLITLSGSTTSLSSASTTTLNDSRIWKNQGTVNYNAISHDHLSLLGTSQFVNESGAIFNINTTDDNSNIQGTGSFSNFGTMTKASVNNTDIDVIFSNSGNVEINNVAGSLEFGKQGTDTGTYSLTAGSIHFQGGTRNLNSGAEFPGMGTLLINGATVNANAGANLDFTGTLKTSSGVLNLNTTTANNINQLHMLGGTVQGSDQTTVTGTMKFTNATYRGTGSLITDTGSVTTLSATNSANLNDDANWINKGTVNYNATSYDHFSLLGASSLLNDVGGVFNLNSTDANSDFTGAGTFTNAGLLKKASASTTEIDMPFHNTGTVEVHHETGAIELGNGGNDTGNYQLTGGKIYFQNGTRTFDGINLTGAGTVVLNGAVLSLNTGTTTTIDNLTATSGIITGAGDLHINNNFIVQNITLRGSGNLLTQSGSTTSLSSGATTTMNDSRTWTNQGVVNFNATSYDHFSLQGTSQFVNAAGGIFNLNSSDPNSDMAGSGSFTNAGSMSKTSVNATDVDVLFHNTGTVEINNPGGVIEFGKGGTDTGTYSLVDGGVYFQGGTRELNAGVQFSGNGTLLINGATVNANPGSNMNIAGKLQTSSGTLTLNSGTAISFNQLNILGGTVQGADNSTVTGSMQFNKGTLRGSGTLLTDTGTTTTLSAGNTATMNDSVVWMNKGTVNYNAVSYDHFNLYGTSQFINDAAGVFNLNSSDGNSDIYSNSAAVFTNNGLLEKASSGSTDLSVTFNNAGTVSLNHVSGQLVIGKGGADTGNYVLNAGNVYFQNGTRTFNGINISGSGQAILGGATLSLNAGTGTSIDNFRITSGTLTGDGDLNINNSLTTSGGVLRGAGSMVTESGSVTNLSTTGTTSMEDTRVWTNQGTVNFAATSYDHFQLGGSSQFVNDAGGVFNITSTDSNSSIKGTGSFSNAGTLTKNSNNRTEITTSYSNTGTTRIDHATGTLGFNKFTENDGVIDIQSGVVDIDSSSFTNKENAKIQGFGILNVDHVSTGLSNSGLLIPGNSPGILTVIGDVTLGASSVLDMELVTPGTAGTDFDQLQVSGNVQLGGTLNFIDGAYSPTVNDSFSLVTCSGSNSCMTGGFTDINHPFSVSSATSAITNFGVSSPNVFQYTIDDISLIFNWINAGDGNWNLASNWDQNKIPTASDKVVINQPGTINVTVSDIQAVGELQATNHLVLTGGSLSIGQPSVIDGNLTLAGGDLIINANLDQKGVLNWTSSSSSMSGSGSLNIASGAVMNLLIASGTGQHVVSGLNLNNAGSIVHRGLASNHFTLNNGATLTNQLGAVLDFQNDNYIISTTGGGSLINIGQIQKSAGTGNSIISFGTGTGLSFTNQDNGVFETQSGKIQLSAPGSYAGSLVIQGTPLELTGHTHTFADSSSFMGTLNLNGGDMELLGAFTQDGTLNWNNSASVIGSTSAAQYSIPAASVMNLNITSGSGQHVFNNIALSNLGTINHHGLASNHLTLNNNSALTNQSGGLLDLKSDNYVISTTGGGSLINHGEIRKSSGAGVSRISFGTGSGLTYVNHDNGVLNAQTGSLYMESSASYNGTLVIQGNPLNLTNYTHTFADNSNFTGTLNLAGGDLFLSGVFNQTDTLNWQNSASTISSSGLGQYVIPLGKELNLSITSGTGQHVFSDVDIDNSGKINHKGLASNHLTLNNGSVLNNLASGVLDLQADNYVISTTGGGLLQNYGKIQKSLGSGVSYLSFGTGTGMSLVNHPAGIMDTQSGLIQLDLPASYSGTLAILGNALQLGSYTHSFADASDFTGTLDLVGGDLSLAGSFTQNGTLNWKNSASTVENGGAGKLTIPSTQALNLLIASGSGQHVFNGVIIDNLGSVNHTGLASNHVTLNNGAVFNNKVGALLDLQADNYVISTTGGGFFNNYGTVKKSAGSGVSRISFGTGTGLNYVNHPAAVLNAVTGNIQMEAPAIYSGTLVINGNSLKLANYTHSFANASDFTGTLDLLGGDLALAGSFTQNGTLNWLNSSSQISGGIYELPASQEMNLLIASGSGQHVLNNLIFNNSGRVNHNGLASNHLTLNNGAVFNNLAGGLLDLKADNYVISTTGAGTFNNAGTLRKSNGTGASNISKGTGTGLAFVNQNNGVIQAQSGNIQIDAPATYQGNLTINGNPLRLTNNTHSFSTGGSYTGTIELNGGDLDIPGTFTQDGTLNWNSSSSQISGTGSYQIPSTGEMNLNITSGSGQHVFNSLIVNNEGVINHNGLSSNHLTLNNGATLNNQTTGILDLLADNYVLSTTGGGTLTNTGIIQKANGVGTSIIQAGTGTGLSFATNDGTLTVTSGDMSVPLLLTNNGTIDIAAGSNFLTGAANLTNSATGVIQGNGTLKLVGHDLINYGILSPGASPGVLAIDGDLTLNAGSSLNMELAGNGGVAGVDFDQIVVLGTGTLAGDLNITYFGGTTVTTGNFPLITCTGGCTGNFANINLSGGGTNFTPHYNANDFTFELTKNTNTWTGATDLDWNIASNWSLGVVPTADHVVVIDPAGADTILLNSGTHVIDSILTLGVDDGLSISGGSLTINSSSTLDGSLNLSNTGSLNLLGNTVVNASFYWGGGDLTGTTGELNIANTGSLNYNLGVVKTIPFKMNNQGTVDLQSGQLNLGSDGAHSGAFALGTGTILNFSGGFHELQTSSNISGVGQVQINGATVNLKNGATIGANTLLASGILSMDAGSTMNLPSLNLNGGTMQGSGSVTVTSDFSHASTAMNFAGDLSITHTSGDLNLTTMSNLNTLFAKSTSGKVIIHSDISATGSGDAIQLVGNGFQNNAGGVGLNTPHGRWLVWSADPANDERGGLAYDFKQYNANYGVTTPAHSGSGFLYSLAPTVTPTLIGSTTKVYDQTTNALLDNLGLSVSGVIDGDVVNMDGSGANFDNADVGTNKLVTASGLSIQNAENSGKLVYGYTLASTTASANIGEISAKSIINTSGAVANNKVYDATTSAVVDISALTSTDILTGDTVAFAGGVGTFTDKLVANGKIVTINGITLAGASAGNYTFAGTTTAIADITPATLTPSLTGSVNKVYDATTEAFVAAANYELAGVLGTDVVAVSNTSGSYDSKQVATGKTVTVTGLALNGADAGNYVLANTEVSGAVGSITAANLTADLIGSISKTYDATADAAVTSGNFRLTGILGSDLVGISNTSGSYDSKQVGAGKLVTVDGLTLNGADSSNYTLSNTSVAAALGEITPANLVASLVNAVSKVYDTNTSASLGAANLQLTGVQGSDAISVAADTTYYDTAQVGSAKRVTATGLTLSGVDSGNYVLANTSANANVGEITPASLIVSLQGGVSKIYDMTTDAVLAANNFNLAGVLGSDAVGISNTAGIYDTADVGTDKTISVNGLTLNGIDAGNYTLSTTNASGAIGSIQAATIDVSLTGLVSKVYDTSTTATLNGSNFQLVGTKGTDVLAISYASGVYDNKNVGTGKTVTVSGLNLTGSNAGNYQLLSTDVNGAVGVITPVSLTASLDGLITKTYDATAAATLASDNYNLTGVLGSDVVNVSATNAQYDNKQVGTAKTVSVTGATLGGADAGNYVLTSSNLSGTVGVIDQATLTPGLQGLVSKTYDTTTAATLAETNFNLNGVFTEDDVSISNRVGTYDSANVGTKKFVSVNQLLLAGADATNYRLDTQNLQAAIGEINAANLTVNLTGDVIKTYDATSAASLSPSHYQMTGIQGSDVLSISNTWGVYDTKNVGTAKNVTVTGLNLTGANAENYQLVSTSATGSIGIIEAADLTARLMGSVSKNYDATTAANVVSANFSISGIIDQDDVYIPNATGQYIDKNVGVDKNVSVQNVSLAGVDAANYSLTSTMLSGPIGEITPKSMHVAANQTGKLIDTEDPLLTYSATGLIAGDSLAGQLTRIAGEEEGLYLIEQGSLDNPNYDISYTSALFSIYTEQQPPSDPSTQQQVAQVVSQLIDEAAGITPTEESPQPVQLVEDEDKDEKEKLEGELQVDENGVQTEQKIEDEGIAIGGLVCRAI